MKKFTFLVAALALCGLTGAASDLLLTGVARNHTPIKKQCSLGERVVKSVSCYNVAGQQVAEPTTGVCIKRVQYAAGAISTEKVIK